MNPTQHSTRTIIAIMPVLLFFASCTSEPTSTSNNKATWNQYGGRADQSKYADLTQITKENVNQLRMAWFYPTSDTVPSFFNPIIVDTIMYVVAHNYSLVALNANTGKEIWIHTRLPGITRRG